MELWKGKSLLPYLSSIVITHSLIALIYVGELMCTFFLRKISRVLIVCCVEHVCTVSWPSLLVEKMMRALSKEMQEKVHFLFYKGYGNKVIARVLNMSVGSVHKIREKYLPNVNYSYRGRPQLLNKEMEQSRVLQVTKG